MSIFSFTDLLKFAALFIATWALILNIRNQKISLFDKRQQIYKDSQKLYQEYHDGELDRDTLRKFICSKNDSKYLFPEDSGIYDFLDEVHKAAVSFNGSSQELIKQTEPAVLKALLKAKEESSLVLNNFLHDLSKKMFPYTKIR